MGQRWLVLSASLAAACAAEPSTPPAPTVLQIGEPAEPYEIERLVSSDRYWACVGLLDLDGDRADELVLVAADEIRVVADGGRGATESVALVPAPGTWPIGCDAADIDGDLDLDLAIAGGRGGLVALREPGGWQLVPLPELPDAGGRANAYAVALFDADADGVLDLYVARSIDGSSSSFIVDGCRSIGDDFYCGNLGATYRGTPNVMLEGAGDGTFVVRPGTATEDMGQSQAVATVDLDGDGRQELVVADDAMENRAFVSRGDFSFSDTTRALGLDIRAHGMSVLAGDLDGDGAVDLAFSDIGPPLVMRRAGERFERLGAAFGFAPVAMYAWGAAMEDLDADGDLDLLFESRGRELDTIPLYCEDPCDFDDWPREELLLFRNDGSAHFTAEGAGRAPGSPFAVRDDPFSGGYGLATGDVDRDGVLDVVVARTGDTTDPREPTGDVWLLHGRSSVGRGLTVEAPAGARIEVCAGGVCSTREVQGAHGFGALAARRVFFGIGHADTATVAATYEGERHELGNAAPGELVVWDERGR